MYQLINPPKTEYMKKLLFLLTSAIALVAVASSDATAQTVAKGDNIVSVGGGVGIDAYAEAKITWTQKLVYERIIKDGLFNGKFALGVGLTAGNAYGGKYEGMVAGSYDYYYTVTYLTANRYGSPVFDRQEQWHREGTGTAKADCVRDDVSLQLNATMHYSPTDHWDLYFTIGGGAVMIKPLYSNYRNTSGLGEYERDFFDQRLGYGMKYSYNDLDHVEWQGGKTKFAASVSAFIGGRYWFNNHWAVQLEAGLLNFHIKKSYGHGYHFASIGASYKF